MSREIGLFSPPYLTYCSHGLVKFPAKDYADAFFLSFEDALISLLDTTPLPEGSAFLYPSFFCMDVVLLLEKRGYKAYPYELFSTFEVNLKEFTTLIDERRPALIFLYNPLGRNSELMSQTDWLANIPENCILIEDCADSLLDAKRPDFIHKDHIVIDSTRKLSPFQGARVYHQEGRAFNEPKQSSLRLTILYACINFLNLITYLLPIRLILELKWKLFMQHTDAIGKSDVALKGNRFEHLLFRTLDVKKIKSLRKDLADGYYRALSNLTHLHPNVHLVPVDEHIRGEMRFIPLICKRGIGKVIGDALESEGIYIDTHFDDSPFGQKYDCLLLPLWPTLSREDIHKISGAILGVL